MINRVLKLVRQFHRLSQSETAARLQISKSYLSEIESGVKSPTLDLLENYAQKFRIPASTLLLFAENASAPAAAARQRPTKKIVQFLEWASEGIEEETNGKTGTDS